MGMIGFTVGFIGFLLHNVIDAIEEPILEKALELAKEGKIGIVWCWRVGMGVILASLSSIIIVYFRPSAGGSGIPELIAFLNGTSIRHIYNVRTLLAKFASCAFAVSAGLFAGPEGPMIHIGALVGAGLSQFKSDSMGINLAYFQRFRNPEDRRNFISAGAAAGVSSAFGAPVGGLLFSMEEVSSFWSNRLTWQVFFCSMIAAFTTNIFNSAFLGFHYQLEILNNIIIFIPTICLGILGGGLGSLFVFMNLKIVRLRDWVETFSISSRLKKLMKIAEVVIIITLTATISTTLPLARKCQHQKVPIKTGVSANGKWRYTNQTYNELSSLLYTSQDHAINQLLSRGTHKQYSPEGLLYYFIPYFLLACWTSTASLSVGLVMPMLTIGALYGRMIGELLVIWFGEHFYYGEKYSDASDYKAWMDPGAIALIGAASFFAGVSRLTISLTVIMIEITNDVTMLLPIMTAIMVAKIVGDQLTHPIYHALLEVKCIPILDEEPVVYTQDPNGRSVL
ncbi:unnamed protein product [Oikopleura dioica]|uniref:Chloride channel protein n=1 Tax=Oikopleura dioica TaxID=34765 RepID=E4XUK1_OIKDI|nr:unnamed protein product [Oikopleura dioica]